MIKKGKYLRLFKLVSFLILGNSILLNSSVKAEDTKFQFKDSVFKNILYSETKLEKDDNSQDLKDGDIDKIKELSIYDNYVWNIDGIQSAVNLRKLYIGPANIADLRPISSLTNLKDLSICNCCVRDLSPIKNLKNITRLFCTGLKLDNYDAVGSLENLEYLTLTDCNIKDVSFLKNLKKLKELSLSCNYIEDISGLKDLTKLYIVYLDNNQIKDITPLNNICANYFRDRRYDFEGQNEEEVREEKEYEWKKQVVLNDNPLDITPGNSKTLGDISSKHYTVYTEFLKEDIYLVNVNGEVKSYSNKIDKSGHLWIELNKDIEEYKDNISVYIEDNSLDNEAKIKADYTVCGNILKINTDNAFVNNDYDTVFITIGDIELSRLPILKDYNTIYGDADGNGYVNLIDLTLISKDYNKISIDADTWNPREDVNKDGIIDIYDITKTASQLTDNNDK